MKMYLKISNLILIIFLFTAAHSYAQDDQLFYSDSSSFTSTKYDQLQAIKKQIADLLSQNKRLEAEYAELKDQYEQAKYQRHQYSQKYGSLPQDKLSSKNEIANKNAIYDQTVLDQARNAYSSQELADSQEGRNLLELKQADLQYQKRELELELKLRQYTLQEERRADETELKKIRQQLEENLIEEKKLEDELSSIEDNISNLPIKSSTLKNEVASLQDQIAIIDKNVEFRKKESNILKDKKILKEKTKQAILLEAKAQKDSLSKEVASLEDEFAKLNKTVKTSLDLQNRKQELVNSIVAIDRDNQQLQVKIDDLQEKLRGFSSN